MHIYGGSNPITLSLSKEINILHRTHHSIEKKSIKYYVPTMGSKKRKLSGAAKAAREAKLARQEAQSAHEEAQQDPIELELDEFTAASAAGGTLQEATSRAEGYSPTGKKNDKTSEILLGCLKEFPPEGRENLIRDILARDDASLKNLADSIRRWVFYPSKYLCT